MSRDLAANNVTESQAGTVRPVFFWYGDFSSGAVRVSSHTQDITWGGYTWTGLGTFIGMEELRESGGIEAIGATFHLNGVPSSVLTKALEAGYRRRQCSLYLGFLDSSDALVADPTEWRYLMDRMPIRDAGNEARISVQAESRLVDLQRPREVRMTDEAQRALFAGDVAFEYIVGLQTKEITVGGTASNPNISTMVSHSESGYGPTYAQ